MLKVMSKLYMRQNEMENGGLSVSQWVAYPFCLGPHGGVMDVARGSVGEKDFNIIRHFFKEVGRNQPLLPIEFTLRAEESFSELFHLIPKQAEKYFCLFQSW